MNSVYIYMYVLLFTIARQCCSYIAKHLLGRGGFYARQHICYSAYMLSAVRPSVRP